MLRVTSFIQSSITDLTRPVSTLRLPKDQKQAKIANSRKKFSEKNVEGIKK